MDAELQLAFIGGAMMLSLFLLILVVVFISPGKHERGGENHFSAPWPHDPNRLPTCNVDGTPMTCGIDMNGRVLGAPMSQHHDADHRYG
jgi:hypothetical protein